MLRKTTLALVVTACTALLAGCSPAPSSVVEDFYKSISNGEIEKAISMIDLKQAESVGVSEGKLRGGISSQSKKYNAENCGGIREVITTSEEVRGEVAVLKVDVICKTGKKTSAKETLLKVDGKWKITINM